MARRCRGRSTASAVTSNDSIHRRTARVLLMDRAVGVLRHGACPSLPRAYSEMIDGLPVAEGSAACGTAAARGEVVVVEDVSTDQLTAGFVEIARRFGLASVWSQPLRRADGEVLGTFAVYRGEPHRPTRSEIRAVMNVADLAALAIERSRLQSALEAAANHDSLTGLPNRARFLELVNQRLREGASARRWCSSRSTGSSRSTTPSAGRPANESCWSSRSGCASSSVMRDSSHGWATMRSR